jgi:hypothetical protein
MMPALLILIGVMDKEPTLTQTWGTFLALGVVAGLLARRWRRTLWVSIPLFLLFAWGLVAKFTDPFVGPAIRAEAGWRYVWLSLGAVAAGALFLVVGARHRDPAG